MDNSLLIQYLTIGISILALISSVLIGVNQVKISKLQTDMQNKVELYLLSEPITLRKADGTVQDKIVPGIIIRNIGNNVIYLDKYTFNGREYPLSKEVLPSVAAFNGYHYIYLPTDNTTHISLTIDFFDWQNNPWQTKGYADLKDGFWEITYSPCTKLK